MKLSASRLLVPALIAYIVLAIALTPIGQLETRPVSHVTALQAKLIGGPGITPGTTDEFPSPIPS